LERSLFGKRLIAGVLFWLVLFNCGSASREDDIIAAAKSFFSALNQQNYDRAYSRLSHKLVLSITPENFKITAQGIEGVKVLKFEITQAYQKLARLNLKARVFLWHEGKLYDAVYQGKACLVKEKGSWKLDECEMSPIQQALADPKQVTKNIRFSAD